jgi:hypothetical protein
MQDEAYQQEYDKAAAALEAAANGAKPEAITAPEPEQPEPAKAEEAKEPEQAPAEPEVDPLAEIRAKLEKTEKALKDTQAWGTKNAQRLKEIEQERERQQREASRPEILEQNPGLEEAIRHVTHNPHQEQEQAIAKRNQEWMAIVDAAHPGIFSKDIDPELEKTLVDKAQSLGEQWFDPLIAIREITAEKLAHTERIIGKKYMAEAAKSAQKSAMSVPGAGASAVNTAPVDSQKEIADRYLTMSSADFAKERKRVLGH